MAFSICFSSEEPFLPAGGALSQAGRLQIGEHEESFVATFEHWSRHDYEVSWREALAQALDGAQAALITSMPDPATANVVRWWPVYPRGTDTLLLQEHLLLLYEAPLPFDARRPFALVPSYSSVDGDGYPVSEWRIPKSDVREFLMFGCPS